GLLPDHVQQQQAHQHRGQPDEADLPIAHFGQAPERLAPDRRQQERQDALDDEHQGEGREEDGAGHFDFCAGTSALPWRADGIAAGPYLAGLLDRKYLKNSELGSSTSTSLRPRKLAL